MGSPLAHEVFLAESFSEDDLGSWPTEILDDGDNDGADNWVYVKSWVEEVEQCDEIAVNFRTYLKNLEKAIQEFETRRIAERQNFPTPTRPGLGQSLRPPLNLPIVVRLRHTMKRALINLERLEIPRGAPDHGAIERLVRKYTTTLDRIAIKAGIKQPDTRDLRRSVYAPSYNFGEMSQVARFMS
ncbi:hypothetical protein OQA88_6612 [Cercophora sp. LCS_1]